MRRRTRHPQHSTGRWQTAWLSVVFSMAFACRCIAADVYLSELLFNPPGDDPPHEYIELRGVPNLPLPPHTFLLALEGNAGANPGSIKNVFDLTGRHIGGNGFLLLLQRESPYTPAPACATLTNQGSASGWGSGNSSTIGHRGDKGILELENASVTFILVQANPTPAPGTDLDENDDGKLDLDSFALWTVLDSVGVLDADGAGDFAYGLVNFRRNTSPGNGAGAIGTIIPVSFTPRYIGRTKTSASGTGTWGASEDVTGTAPLWSLAAAPKTFPSELAGAALNHLGAPNFGGEPLPGIVLLTPTLILAEGGELGVAQVALNTAPSGPVTLRFDCEDGLLARVAGVGPFTRTFLLTLTNRAPASLELRAVDDNVLGISPAVLQVNSVVAATADTAHYPLTALTTPLTVHVSDNEWALLSELKLNPPGTNDGPFEYLELVGSAGVALNNIWIVVLDGDDAPGTITYTYAFSGFNFGTSGLLLLTAPDAPYAIPATAARALDPGLSATEGLFPNRACTFLLLASAHRFSPGEDLDANDNGVLEALPEDTRLLDSLAFSSGNSRETLYSPARAERAGILPDAAIRVPGNYDPESSVAWRADDILGTAGAGLEFAGGSSGNWFFAGGTKMTPGLPNALHPIFPPLSPLSGVIGHAHNPQLELTVHDVAEGQPINVWFGSSNPLVLPASGITLTSLSEHMFTLTLCPTGVGYSDLSLFVSAGGRVGNVTVPYAASNPELPATAWLLGSSDASAGVPAGDAHVWVADDEDQRIRLYDTFGTGLPIRTFDVGPFLELPDAKPGWPREVDIEGAARVAELILWTGSHGHAASGEPRTNRTRLFATGVKGSGPDSVLTYVGRYDYLKADLIAWDNANAHGKGARYFGLEASDADGVPPKAPDGSGFAIEGLAMIPGSTNAGYVAFRAPIVPATNRTYALLVPVLNLVELASARLGPGSARFGGPVELDLYNRGIRSLESDSEGFLLIAGPPGGMVGGHPEDFRFYRWSGVSGESPVLLSAELRGLNPEGIMHLPLRPWTDNSAAIVASDNGTTLYYGDDIPAKQLPFPNFKKWRLDAVELGSAIKPMPVITRTSLDQGELRVTWRSLAGERYTVQTASSLETPVWTDRTAVSAAEGPYMQAMLPFNAAQTFVRVCLREQP